MKITIDGFTYDPQKQIEKFEKWTLTPTGRSHEVISENIKFLYEQANQKPVPIIVCDTVADFEVEIKTFVKNNSVRASVWASVGDSVWASVGDSVWASVGDSVWASVRDSVRDSVGDSVWASVRDSVGAYYWSDDLAFIDTFLKNGIKLDSKLEKRFYKNMDVLSDCSMGFITDSIAIVLVKPTVTRDNRKRLHNEEDMAIKWADNDGFYFLHGVKFEKSLWESVVGKKMTFTEVMGIVDIDQRWVAMKFMDTDKLLKGANAKLLDSTKRNSLYLIEGLFPNAPKAYFLRYSCPSTERVYLSGIIQEVGEKGNADLAQAWKHGFSLQEYNNLIAEY